MLLVSASFDAIVQNRWQGLALSVETDRVNPLRLRKTLAFLLRHRPDIGRLKPDPDGWYDVLKVTKAVSRLLKIRIQVDQLIDIVEGDPQLAFQVKGDFIRILELVQKPQRIQKPPDILYMASNKQELLHFRRHGFDAIDFKLHTREYRAWMEAHRAKKGEPTVLYIDASRARRAKVNFRQIERGIYTTRDLPNRFVLNLKQGFGFQSSAGGFLVRRHQGNDEVALVKVRRRSGVTWEVAKGKIEIGESPQKTAIRELREEMGINEDLSVIGNLGISHYGFTTPDGEPRLKVLHLFILTTETPIDHFVPETREGIEEVSFFEYEKIPKLVTHGSLQEPVKRLGRWLRSRESDFLMNEE